MLEVYVRVPLYTGSKVYPIQCNDDSLIWHLKIQLFSISAIPPAKQSIFLSAKDTKEIEVCVLKYYFFLFLTYIFIEFIKS